MADLRIPLNDKTLERLQFCDTGRYIVRDTDLKGFFVVIGAKKKTFTVQGDLRQEGKRASSIRVAIGECSKMSTRTARAIAKDYLSQISRGLHPKGEGRATKLSTAVAYEAKSNPRHRGVTLREAWERYRTALERKNRSERTIASYRDHVERLFEEWLDTPLQELGDNPAKVIAKHDTITETKGPYIANGSMRTLRAIYNHARKTNRDLPADNPVICVDWNGEKRRNSGMGLADLRAWFHEVASLDNPVRREFHLFTLLSACRPTALKEARIEHIDWARRILHVPKPKGGADRAFDIPLSRQMVRSLVRAIRIGRIMHPDADGWLFPADSASGHIVEQKEDRATLSKWGNDLRQTYRTVATPAGVSELDARMLMNHSVPGVNAGYITRSKLLENHLRAQQQAISDTIFRAVGMKALRDGVVGDWIGARRRGLGRPDDRNAARSTAVGSQVVRS